MYEVPLGFARQGVDEFVLRVLKIDAPPGDVSAWAEMVHRLNKDLKLDAEQQEMLEQVLP